jgi:hypothetical protein
MFSLFFLFVAVDAESATSFSLFSFATNVVIPSNALRPSADTVPFFLKLGRYSTLHTFHLIAFRLQFSARTRLHEHISALDGGVGPVAWPAFLGLGFLFVGCGTVVDFGLIG